MTFYDGVYPFYPLQRTSFIFSGRLLATILVFLALAASLLLILPGIRGKSRLLWMFRIILSFFIGAVTVALNFTCDWAEARTTTNAPYKAFSSAAVSAELGVHVGLNGVNVTLKGTPAVQFNETIDYNEMFTWHGTIEEEYEEALERGLPNPILYVAEKLTSSSTYRLASRHRHAGRYASATLWSAFCCWLLANVLLSMPVVLYAGYMMLATAAFVFLSAASFSAAMNAPPCVFNIGDDSFQTRYSHSFWLALATGLLCATVGVLVVSLTCAMPEKMKEVFGAGDLDEEDVSYGEGYPSSVFLDDLTAPNARLEQI